MGALEEIIRKAVDVSSIPDAELLKRAVTNARARHGSNGGRSYRWVAVMDAFNLGAGYAQQLCARFNLDPDEIVKR